MAFTNNIHSGTQGIVYVGDDATQNQAVLNIRSFSIEETQETIDATTMDTSGVSYRTTKPTFQSWSGSVDVYWTTKDDDTPGNATDAMAFTKPGKTEVTINFWPTGDDQYELGYVGNAIITGRTISSSVDGMIEMSITVQGTGALTVDNGGTGVNGTTA